MTLHSRVLLPLLASALLIACSGGESTEPQGEGVTESSAEIAARLPEIEDAPRFTANDVPMDGRITLSVDRLIEETDPNNCLVMLAVRNGTQETVSAGLFAFDVEGAGETAGGNMFPQTAEPSEMKTAQVILPGRSCDVVERVVGGQPACTVEGGEPGSCLDTLELVDAEADFTLNDPE